MMQVQITNYGASVLDANAGPVQLDVFKIGSGYNYTPKPTDTDIHGTEVYSGTPTPYGVVNPNVVKYSVIMDTTVGPFAWGECGLYYQSQLFALATSPSLIQKLAQINGAAGNSARIDIYLSMVDGNYDMWLDVAESNNPFRIATLGSVDQLPPSASAVPNCYIISGYSDQQSAFEAYTDRQGLWNFDAYAYANQAQVTITGATSTSVSIALSDYQEGFSPKYTGEIILEFTSGAVYSICRYVTSTVSGPQSVTLNFGTPLAVIPQAGDTIVLFGRQALSTTVVNLPIATSTVLGGIKVGTTLTVQPDGTLNVNAASFPVTSVNGMTGDVVVDASNIEGFAKVAYSGQYSDIIGAPGAYTLPVATQTRLGGVKAPQSGNLTVAADGTIDLGFSPVKTVDGVSPDINGNVVVPPEVGLVNPKQIQATDDLNTYQTSGLYFATSSTQLVNAPTTNPAVLEIVPYSVTATGFDVIQRWTDSSSMWFRYYNKTLNTWSAWTGVRTTNQATIPIATQSTLGGVIIGTGLNVTSAGVLSTQIQTVNGKSDQNIVLDASDVNAIGYDQLDQFGGIPFLDSPPDASVSPNTNPYTYGRLAFFENSLGTWWNAGQWDAAANHVIQSQTGNTAPDTNTALLANGQQTIDISFNGKGRATMSLPTPDYQTVSGEGQVYQVITAGTTNLDGTSQWDVGDLVVGINGKWTKITVNFTNVVFSAGTY